MNKYLKGSIIMVLFLLLAFLTPLFSTVSVLKGYVKDKKTDEPLAKVKITVIFLRNTSVRFQLVTDKKGYFYKTGLKNGMYQVNFDKVGYTPAQHTIRLKVAEQREMDIQLERIEVTTSETSFGLVNAANKLMAAGKYDEAIEKVSRAIEKDPGTFILYYNRAVAYEKKGEKEKAVLDYKKSLELKPDFLLSLSALGNIYARKADFPGAVEYYQKAFELGITDTVVLYNYGACLINLGDNDRGKAVFEKLIELDPSYADAYYQMGIIYLGMNENAKAREFLEKFIELDPENSNAAVAREILNTLN
ncbi:MAG: tetratricopeptide repeat protein [Candidatus Aminicenantes bacterium]|nr:MAG: tetratricopeptide repeat protein [Candidatus Aminicenantes bacterium]